ncbi:hypothetical protein KXD93_16725 [Mucilaginibacter sp. BJC16-A38]|uniref:hypothetical protein n=1 Tax=Mucilaginibacter phenanthrenivorans TaxID=1234842 RepID=UPI002156FACE|nr:hypothetical protein [Mucilaginibacter phenanthrenivorans]MCR8559304.1 hypothetical protein [Mucilaginibacter phenanthrenivorans]
MMSILCDFLILLSTLILGLLTFSKEIAQKFKRPYLDEFGFKILMLVVCVIIGALATRQKEHISSNETKVQEKKVDSLKSEFIEELKGADLPIFTAYVYPKTQILTFVLSNRHRLPIYSLSVNFIDYYAYAKSNKLTSISNERDSTFFSSLFMKNESILVISPKRYYHFYSADIGDSKLSSFFYNINVAWRNGHYKCKVIVEKKDGQFFIKLIEYKYQGQKYDLQSFLKKFYPTLEWDWNKDD